MKILVLFATLSCTYHDTAVSGNMGIIPNGDFEKWDGLYYLSEWITNSCPPCVPPYETYVVQKDSAIVFHGKYAAKFIYNDVYPSQAENKFPISFHPDNLLGYVKCDIRGMDTVFIKIKLYNKSIAVDSGVWYGAASIASYQQLQIAISHHATMVDSAMITIRGGKVNQNGWVNTTALWVDNLSIE